MNHRLLTTQDLADRLGISSSVLREWRKQGKGPCFVRIGHMIRYPVQEVELFERQFKSRSDWVVTQLAPEPEKISGRAIRGRLRRPGFSEQRTETIITAYLDQLLCPNEIPNQSKAMEDYSRLMTLQITSRNLDESQIEIGRDQLSPEILFVDLLNTLDKLTFKISMVMDHARSRLTTLDPVALQTAVDQYADMSTRTHIRKWVGRSSD